MNDIISEGSYTFDKEKNEITMTGEKWYQIGNSEVIGNNVFTSEVLKNKLTNIKIEKNYLSVLIPKNPAYSSDQDETIKLTKIDKFPQSINDIDVSTINIDCKCGIECANKLILTSAIDALDLNKSEPIPPYALGLDRLDENGNKTVKLYISNPIFGTQSSKNFIIISAVLKSDEVVFETINTIKSNTLYAGIVNAVESVLTGGVKVMKGSINNFSITDFKNPDEYPYF